MITLRCTLTISVSATDLTRTGLVEILPSYSQDQLSRGRQGDRETDNSDFKPETTETQTVGLALRKLSFQKSMNRKKAMLNGGPCPENRCPPYYKCAAQSTTWHFQVEHQILKNRYPTAIEKTFLETRPKQRLRRFLRTEKVDRQDGFPISAIPAYVC